MRLDRSMLLPSAHYQLTTIVERQRSGPLTDPEQFGAVAQVCFVAFRPFAFNLGRHYYAVRH